MTTSWSVDTERHCYSSGTDTPYWLIIIGFSTSLLINSFVLFSGQSLTSQLWTQFKSLFKFLYDPCCRISSKPSKDIEYPSIIYLSIYKNTHNDNIDNNEYDLDNDPDSNSSEYDFDGISTVTHKATIDVAIQQTLLEGHENASIMKDDSGNIINHDISLSTNEISGYYKLLKPDLYDKYPIYESTHKTLSSDTLLLHYIGTTGQYDLDNKLCNLGWAISYKSLYGFRNELFQRIACQNNEDNIDEDNKANISDNRVLPISINSANYIDMKNVNVYDNNAQLRMERMRLRGVDECIWKLCQLDSYQNLNKYESEIICYDGNGRIIDGDDDIALNAVKLQLNDFCLITAELMDTINVNGNYNLLYNVNKRKSRTPHRRPPPTPKSRAHPSFSSVLSHSACVIQHSLMTNDLILRFQHETDADIQIFVVNKAVPFKSLRHRSRHRCTNKLNIPRAAIFHSKLQQFIAYVPADYDDAAINILDGSEWRMIEWQWKTINNLKISVSYIVCNYYFVQLLSIWVLSIGLYQWYEDIASFIKYYQQYHDTDSYWKQYECYAFIVTNTPNMKQLVLMIGLIFWGMRTGFGGLNYAAYLQKQTIFQKTLVISYSLLLLLVIPPMFTHYLPMFISFFLFVYIVLVCMRMVGRCFCEEHITEKRAAMRKKKKIAREKAKELSDVTSPRQSYGADIHRMVGFALWKFAVIYFVMILCVPVMAKVYGGMHMKHAIAQTYTARKTNIYFQNIATDYVVDLNKLRLLFYWLL